MEDDTRHNNESSSESYMKDPWSCYEDEDAACGGDSESAEEDCCCCCCC
jgi:hypothetical protein